MIEMYPAKSVAEIAALTGKSERSVIATLVRAGVYQKKPVAPRSKNKLELIAAIAASLGVVADITSLEKANKPALQALYNSIVKEVS